MNILHVLSGDILTGSETSTAAVIEQQLKAGHKVIIASGSFTTPTSAKWIQVPIYNRGLFRRFLNVGALAQIIRDEEIDLVHSHSRAASWVAHWACKQTKTANLSTLHGRQNLHFSNKYFNVYGKRCIAVCEDIRDQMLEGTKVFKREQLAVIRNGLSIKKRNR